MKKYVCGYGYDSFLGIMTFGTHNVRFIVSPKCTSFNETIVMIVGRAHCVHDFLWNTQLSPSRLYILYVYIIYTYNIYIIYIYIYIYIST